MELVASRRRSTAPSPRSAPRPASRSRSAPMLFVVERAPSARARRHDACPQVVRDPALPERVTIYEVGPRDGLQNEQAVVRSRPRPSSSSRLVAAGLPVVEATSFVHPRGCRSSPTPPSCSTCSSATSVASPADAGAGAQRARPRPGAGAGSRHIAIFGSATETFAQRTSTAGWTSSSRCSSRPWRRARDAGLDVRAYVSMCFGDPWEGDVPVDQVVAVGKRLFDLGASQLSLGDTIGVGTPGHVVALLDGLNAAGLADDVLAVHFHDTYGQALSNALAALRHGVTTFDASAGGLGGCPYAESATGNLATEDLVWMLNGLGIETGVDLEPLVATSAGWPGRLGRPSPSRVRPGAAMGQGRIARHDSSRVPPRRGAEDGHDVPPGPARRSTAPSSPVTTCTTRSACRPATSGRPRPARRGSWGGQREDAAASGTSSSTGSGASTTAP